MSAVVAFGFHAKQQPGAARRRRAVAAMIARAGGVETCSAGVVYGIGATSIRQGSPETTQRSQRTIARGESPTQHAASMVTSSGCSSGGVGSLAEARNVDVVTEGSSGVVATRSPKKRRTACASQNACCTPAGDDLRPAPACVSLRQPGCVASSAVTAGSPSVSRCSTIHRRTASRSRFSPAGPGASSPPRVAASNMSKRSSRPRRRAPAGAAGCRPETGDPGRPHPRRRGRETSRAGSARTRACAAA